VVDREFAREMDGSGYGKILIVDDDEGFREVCGELSLDMGLEPFIASDGIEALEILEHEDFALALVDLKMPKMNGLDFLSQSRKTVSSMPVVIVTGYGSVETAVEAMKLGAVDYITKPSSISEIRSIIKRIMNVSSVGGREEREGRFGIIGRSRVIKLVYERIEAMASADNTVLIMGESGVGKELVAKAIHFHGNRRDEPFIPIDCSVLSLSIVESELFGHFKGAFTDARFDKVGLLKLAGRGTVFLDEITEIPLEVQAKLLRAIQEREIRPVGGSETEKIEARIIAATNRELEKAVRDGKFREDLFYRLHVIPISVPPLRERTEDIPLLVDYFINRYNTERRQVTGISEEALDLLMSHEWFGNVRELENVMQHAIALGSGDLITPDDLPKSIYGSDGNSQPHDSRVKPLREMERDAIIAALDVASGNRQDAARILGIGKTTLYEKIKKYAINTPGDL